MAGYWTYQEKRPELHTLSQYFCVSSSSCQRVKATAIFSNSTLPKQTDPPLIRTAYLRGVSRSQLAFVSQ